MTTMDELLAEYQKTSSDILRDFVKYDVTIKDVFESRNGVGVNALFHTRGRGNIKAHPLCEFRDAGDGSAPTIEVLDKKRFKVFEQKADELVKEYTDSKAITVINVIINASL
jgi:hypothetical protein